MARASPRAATSAATGAVANVNDLPTGSVTITGTPTQGRTLTAANTLADVDGLGTITYQWQADGVDIGGATGTTLVLSAAEVGKAITAIASYTDQHGTAEAVPSSPTALVSADGDPPTVVSFTPADEDGSAPLGTNIVFTFDETIVAGSGNIVLKTSTGCGCRDLQRGQQFPPAFRRDNADHRPVIGPDARCGLQGGIRVRNGARPRRKRLCGRTRLQLRDGQPAHQRYLDERHPGRAPRATTSSTGGLGSDRMIGGLGDDTYYVDNAGDVVVEQPGGGIDHVIVAFPYLPWTTYVLSANVENLTLSDSPLAWLPYPINGTGNGLDNVLIGNSSANKLTGLAGADTLVGGLGADRFVYLSASDSGTTPGTWDVIQDFSRSQGDKIDLQAIDANTSAFGDQAFVFIGTAAFGANATAQLRFDAGTHMLYGSTDADSDAEFSIELSRRDQPHVD